MPSSAPTSALRRLIEDRISQLAAEAEDLLTDDRERARREFAEQMNQSARRLRQAVETEELAATLVDAASAFAAGVAFFRIDGDVARGERIRGVPEERAGRFPGMAIPLAAAAALGGAVESRDPVTAVAAATEVSAEMIELAGHPADGRVSIFPVLVRDRVRALLYAWGPVQLAATELLCQVAAAAWAGIEPPTAAAPAPDLVQIAGAPPRPRPSWESLPAHEQQIHLRAQRWARVRAAEMRLHEGQPVQAGRARNDLYGSLREQIDAARSKFHEQFFVACPSMVDYLHLELVRTLANENAEALGKDYPGPLV